MLRARVVVGREKTEELIVGLWQEQRKMMCSFWEQLGLLEEIVAVLPTLTWLYLPFQGCVV